MADARACNPERPDAKFQRALRHRRLVLYEAGVADFSKYAVVPGTKDSEMLPDFFATGRTRPSCRC